ncbi:MAG: FG-GAP repeat domain-containing protein [Planctomycetota bacterium]
MSDYAAHTSCGLLVAALLASSAVAQQFELLQKDHGQSSAAPSAVRGFPADADGTGTIDVLLDNGSILLNAGQLGFSLDPAGSRIPLATTFLLQGFDGVADLNGDGFPDLVSEDTGWGPPRTDIRVGYGSASGVFTASQLVTSGSAAFCRNTYLDVDGDGRIDILGIGAYGSYLLRNTTIVAGGTPSFLDVTSSSLPAGLAGSHLASADFDGDGDVDIVYRDPASAIQILANDGSGGFALLPNAGLPLTAELPFVAVGDDDGDGDLDLLIVQRGAAPARLLRNDGLAGFSDANYQLPTAASGAAFEDLDGDGDADLLVVDRESLAMTPYRNDGAGLFVAMRSVPIDRDSDVSAPMLADLDGDGDRDVVLRGTQLFVAAAAFEYVSLQERAVADSLPTEGLVAADVDGDGIVDLAVGNTLRLGDGDGFAREVVAVGASNEVIRALVDLDGDGVLDIVWTTPPSISPAQAGVRLGLGATSYGASQPIVDAIRGRVVTADLDGDGLLDLCSEAGVVLRNGGNGQFAAPASPPSVLGVGVPAIADFDGDGLLDLVYNNPGTNNGWTQWRNVGGLQFQDVGGPPFLSPSGFAVGDYDNDGDVDLALTAAVYGYGPSGNTAQVWENDGGVLTILEVLAALGSGLVADNVAMVDIDEDGDLDVVGQRVLLQDSTGALVEHPFGRLGADEFVVADLDGDDDLDLVYSGEGRIDTFVNRHRHLGTPRIAAVGMPYTVELAVRPGYGVGGDLVVPALNFARIAPVATPSLGVLHLDPATSLLFGLGLTDADGNYEVSLTIPNVPAAVGLPLNWQGIVVDPAGVRLTGFRSDIVTG